jgi:hypothetical protein
MVIQPAPRSMATRIVRGPLARISAQLVSRNVCGGHRLAVVRAVSLSLWAGGVVWLVSRIALRLLWLLGC